MHPKGWHSRGYLPHFDSPEALQFLTYRLVDSLPVEAIEKLRLKPTSTDAERDALLDIGAGNCWLGQPVIAAIVQDALLHFDKERYRLIAWAIMPNHVHVMIETVDGHRLGDIVGSWKRFSTRMANRQLGREGAFWQDDYWAGLVDEPEQWPWGSARLRLAGAS